MWRFQQKKIKIPHLYRAYSASNGANRRRVALDVCIRARSDSACCCWWAQRASMFIYEADKEVLSPNSPRSKQERVG